MANVFGKMKESAQNIISKFFYGPEDEQEGYGEEVYQPYSGQPYSGQPYAQQVNTGYATMAHFQPQAQSVPSEMQQPPQAQMPVFQQPQQPQAQQAPVFQQPQQPQAQQAPVFQQPQQPQAQQAPVFQQPQQPQSPYTAPFQPTSRNRRADQTAPAAPAAAEAAPQPAAIPQTVPALQSQALPGIRVMNIRSILDCRAAITLLRQGDIVLATMEGISDATEMRRYVDTLSGACFSLTATITKVSRYGTYLLAPLTMGVYCDSVVSQMNSPARPRPVQKPQAASPFDPPARPQGHKTYSQQIMAQQQGYEEQAPAEEYAAQEAPQARQQFYARPAQQEGRRPVFEQQPAGYGYMPDTAGAEE